MRMPAVTDETVVFRLEELVGERGELLGRILGWAWDDLFTTATAKPVAQSASEDRVHGE
jgi:hypothetical protein